MSLSTAKAALGPAEAPWIDPPLLLDVASVVQLVGESLRGRLLTVDGIDGAELCLRPDMTIPTALHYAASPLAGRPAAYRYDGPIFRAPDSDDPAEAEIPVLGVERFAESDRAAVDVGLLAGALAVCGEGAPLDITLTDLSVFDVFLSAMAVDEPWASRLSAASRRPASLERLLDGEDFSLSADDPARALIGLPPEAARARALDFARASEIGTLAGRTADQIADRLTTKALLAASPLPPERVGKVLRALLAASGDPSEVRAARETLARREGLGIDDYLQHAARRLDAIQALLPADARVTANPRVQGAFWYYDGFMFQIRRAGAVVAAGGRYDGLLRQMTQGRLDAPAAGFTVYPNRLGGSR
ncbi:MAG: hisZ [Caulobacteraceae bacterium]|nr:hisZ [Caulobacteraceae bacterium]